MTQEIKPKTHIRKVHTGRVGSSVVGTVKRTCSIGDISSSSSLSGISPLFKIVVLTGVSTSMVLFLENVRLLLEESAPMCLYI